MGKQKLRHVRIIDAQQVIRVDERRPGANKSKAREYLRELMREADTMGRRGAAFTLEYCQDGARAFASYRYYAGGGEAVYLGAAGR